MLLARDNTKVVLYKDGDPIRINPKQFEALALGRKRSTIRTGVRVAVPGCSLIVCTQDGRHIAKVVESVIAKRVNEITQKEAKSDGFQSKQELVRAFKEYYRTLTENDVMTIINFL